MSRWASPMSTSSKPRSRTRRTWPTAASPSRSSWPSRCAVRCCWRASRAWARPRSPGRWRSVLGAELIRLQCYEGIDAGQALYEWDYARQLLYARTLQEGALDPSRRAAELYGPEFLVERPLLRAVRAGADAVLLIDEIDRADEEFEAFLLEVLVGLGRHDPRDRDDHRRRAAGRGADLQPHPRAARRAQAPLPLPLDRLPGPRAGGGDHPPARPRGLRGRWRARWPRSSRGCGSSTSPSAPARPRPSTGRARWRPSASSASTPRRPTRPSAAALKNHDDLALVRRILPGGHLSVSGRPGTGDGPGARAARRAGSRSGRGACISMTRGVAAVGPEDLYWAARATLISRREDIPAFDRAFEEAFGIAPAGAARRRRSPTGAGRIVAPTELSVDAGPAGDAEEVEPREPDRGAAAQELRRLHAGGAGGARAPDGARCGCAPRPGARAAARAPAPASPTCAAPCAARCARAASRSTAPGGGGGCSRGACCWCSTSPGRCQPTRGPWRCSPTPPCARGPTGRRSPSAPGSPA